MEMIYRHSSFNNYRCFIFRRRVVLVPEQVCRGGGQR